MTQERAARTARARRVVPLAEGRMGADGLVSPRDESSCANTNEVIVSHYSFAWHVDLTKREIAGQATLTAEFLAADCASVVLDSHESISP